MWLVSAAAVLCVVFCNLHLLVDDKRKADGLPDVSVGFEARLDRCNRTKKFVNWPVLGRSCNLWEGGRAAAGFDHFIDGGGACFHHCEGVVGLQKALK